LGADWHGLSQVQQCASPMSFNQPLIGKIDVRPSREAILSIPHTLAVAQ
jgi:hypothetical protein